MTKFERITFALCAVFIIISFIVGFNYKNINSDIVFSGSEENTEKLEIADKNKSYDKTKTENNEKKTDIVNTASDEKMQVSGKTSENSGKNPVPDKKIDLNTDNVNALVSVPGIGEKTAEAIINYRKQNGDFKNLKEMINVKGIGEKKYEKFKNYFYVKGER